MDGFTPMHLAAGGGAPPAVLRRLLDAYPIVPWQKVWKLLVLPRGGGGPPDEIDAPETRSVGRLPLHCCAAGAAHAAAIAYLLEVYPPAAKAVDAGGRTPLHLACMGAAPEDVVVRLLDANGEAAAVTDHHAKLPLEYALEARPQQGRVLHALACSTARKYSFESAWL